MDISFIGLSLLAFAVFVIVIIISLLIGRMIRSGKKKAQSPLPSEGQPRIIREEVVKREVIVKVRCSYCGAQFDESLDKCPNCGAKH